MERWLPVVGYEGLYEVSDLGRVRALRPGHRPGVEPRILTQTPLRGGYLSVTLRKDGKSKLPSVASTVLTAFVGPRPPEHEAAHGDGVRTNNALTNLRWATRSENRRDKVLHGTTARGELSAVAKLTWEAVEQIRSALAQGGRSQRQIAATFGISQRTIQDIKTGRTWREEWQDEPH